MEVIVIGGSTAGLKAACRIRRLQPDARVRVLVKDEFAAYSPCGLPYYLSGDIPALETLAKTPYGVLKDVRYFREVKGVEVVPNCEALAVNRTARLIRARLEGRETEFPYDKLVIATGSLPVVPSLPGIDHPHVTTFASPRDALKLRQDLEKGLVGRAAVVGGGLVGVMVCEAFRSMWEVEVDLIEVQPHVLSGIVDPEVAALVEAELTRNGVRLHLGCGCREVMEDDGRLCIFDHDGNMFQVDRLVLAVGTQPNSALAAAAGLDIGLTGGIRVNSRLQTNDPDIYAAGDCVELVNAVDGGVQNWSMGSLASRMGRVVGDNICNGDSHFGAVCSAAVCRVFGVSVAAVGLPAAECAERGFQTECIWVTLHDRMHFFPGAVPLRAKLVVDRGTSRVMGAQFLSPGPVLHLVDAASQFISRGARVDELAQLEHACAPPFAQPAHPLHLLARVWENSRSAGIRLVPPDQIADLPEEVCLLDVRTKHESAALPVDTRGHPLVHIPLEDLRARLNEVPRDRPIVIVCQMGGRSWDAALLLRRSGWQEVALLAGGLLFQPPPAERLQPAVPSKE